MHKKKLEVIGFNISGGVTLLICQRAKLAPPPAPEFAGMAFLS